MDGDLNDLDIGFLYCCSVEDAAKVIKVGEIAK